MKKAIILLQIATLLALITMIIVKGIDALLVIATVTDICSIVLNIYVDRRNENANR